MIIMSTSKSGKAGLGAKSMNKIYSRILDLGGSDFLAEPGANPGKVNWTPNWIYNLTGNYKIDNS